jgi:hypothetical protein
MGRQGLVQGGRLVGQRQYVSTDPNFGAPIEAASEKQYVSTDPNFGEPVEVKGKAQRFGESFVRNVLPSTRAADYVEGPIYAAQHPIDSISLVLKALWDAHAGQATQARESARRALAEPTLSGKLGAASQMVGHGAAAVLPLIGPAAANAGEQIASGDIAGGLGAGTGVLANVLAPRAVSSANARIRGPLRETRNPNEAAAVQFGRENQIPLDAGTVTGSQFVKNVQKKAGGSWGGANTVETTQRAQGEALAATGRKLAEQTNSGPAIKGKAVGGVEAGEGVQSALKRSIEESHQTATNAYSKLREIESKKPSRPAPADGMTALDVSQRTPLAVDVTEAVKQLQPLYKQLKRESELGIPMHGAKGRTLAALDGLMDAPNWAPLSVVDGALSDLKAMARGADMPELRTAGQATAAQAVRQLDAQVRAAAARGGPEVLKALEEGRAATKAKHVTSEAMDLIVPANGEPRAVFARLTANRDAGLTKLRTLQEQAPNEVQNVGRAVLEEILDRPTSEGGFKFADKALADWQKLGPETKKILFPKDGHAKALDQFFLLAKRIGENPNPSGTAQTLNATNVIAGVPMYVISKMLYTPKGVRALTGAIELGVSPRAGARAAAMTRLTQAANEAGVSLPGKAADATSPEESRRALGRAGQR